MHRSERWDVHLVVAIFLIDTLDYFSDRRGTGKRENEKEGEKERESERERENYNVREN